MLKIRKTPDYSFLQESAKDASKESGYKIPEVTDHFIDLPLTTLHYVKAGEGPPLIMVPATISEINNWLPLVQFMGQRFTAYFFELPGHGQSSPFSEPWSSDLVAQTIEDMIDRLGFETISVMGFSFGGLLAMKALFHLQQRVDQMILISPAATHRALPYSKGRIMALQLFAQILKNRLLTRYLSKLLQNEKFGIFLSKSIRKNFSIEESVPLEEQLKNVQPSTFEVLAYQLMEVLELEYPYREEPFSIPCYFSMSIFDPLLDFETTLDAMRMQFNNMQIERLYFPYHQPEKLPTFDDLMKDYYHILQSGENI